MPSNSTCTWRHLEAPEAITTSEVITTSGGYSRGQAVTGDEESDAGQEVVWFKGIWFYRGPHCYNLGIDRFWCQVVRREKGTQDQPALGGP